MVARGMVGAMVEALPNVHIVLVRPRGSGNIGTAARAMKNMGLTALTLVEPTSCRRAPAEAMAVHARDVVRAARTAANLADAVADCTLVVGTSCRAGGYRAGIEDAETLAPAIVAAAARGPVAIVFGPEDHGLSNADLRHCDRLLTIDTSPAYASLNLAQAVLLVCHELRRAARAGAPPAAAPPPAAAGDVHRMYDHLQRALLAIGFLHRDNPEHLMFALRRLFGRIALTAHEVRILLGIARQMQWVAGRANAGTGGGLESKSVTGDRLAMNARGVRGDQLPVEEDYVSSERLPVSGGTDPLPAADHRPPVTDHPSPVA
jgi:tRNA/rRNA methyltransferase